jgi:hypothetical protein
MEQLTLEECQLMLALIDLGVKTNGLSFAETALALSRKIEKIGSQLQMQQQLGLQPAMQAVGD